MKASNYHAIDSNPICDFISEYTNDFPVLHEKIAELSWCSDDDMILCLNDMEEEFNILFSPEQLEKMFDGEMKLASLFDGELEKTARLSTAKEKAQSRQYRMRNKAALARKAKIRSMKTKAGIHKVKQRVGTAAGGYSFVQKPGGGLQTASQGSVSHATSGGSGHNFNPNAHVSSKQEITTLRKLAMAQLFEKHMKYAGNRLQAYRAAEAEYNRMHKEAQIGVGEEIENKENPIAGKLGFPTPPPGRKKVKTPTVAKPPKMKSALTHGSLPQNKVNREPKFK